MNKEIVELLGDKASYLLEHECKTVSKDLLHLPGPDFVDRVWAASDRNNRVLGSLQRLFGTGRLAGTRLHVDPARGPGDRAFGRRELREEPGRTSTPRTS